MKQLILSLEIRRLRRLLSLLFSLLINWGYEVATFWGRNGAFEGENGEKSTVRGKRGKYNFRRVWTCKQAPKNRLFRGIFNCSDGKLCGISEIFGISPFLLFLSFFVADGILQKCEMKS